MDPIIAALIRNPFLTPQQYMKVVHTSRSSTYKGIRNKSIPSWRQGKTVLIPTSWIVAKMQLGTTESAA
jgi:hypothetical protein